MPVPDVARHGLLESLALHLLPGLAPLACMLGLGPVVESHGLPPVLAFYLGAFLGVTPVQLGILYFLGWRRNGRLSLEGIVVLREEVPAGRTALYVLGLFVWATLAFGLLGRPLSALLMPAFEWMPASVRLVSEELAGVPRAVGMAIWAVGLVGVAWLAPFVEELYFRGFLLPRVPVAHRWAPPVNASLFALYHLWSPWQALTRIVAVTPLSWAAMKTRSLRIPVLAHCLLNTASMVGPLVSMLRG